jgi:hypothetical protein
MIVKVNGKETQHVSMDNLRKLTFEGEKLTITTINNEETLNIPLLDIVLVFNIEEETNTKDVKVEKVENLQIWQSGGFLYIQSDQPLGTVLITDLQGRRMIYSKSAENTTSINISALQKGVYILQVNRTALKFILK